MVPSDGQLRQLRPPHGIHQLRSDPRLKVRRRHVPQAVEVHGKRATKPSLVWEKGLNSAGEYAMIYIYICNYIILINIMCIYLYNESVGCGIWDAQNWSSSWGTWRFIQEFCGTPHFWEKNTLEMFQFALPAAASISISPNIGSWGTNVWKWNMKNKYRHFA